MTIPPFFIGWTVTPANVDLDALLAAAKAYTDVTVHGAVSSSKLVDADVALTLADAPNQLAPTALTAGRNVTLPAVTAANMGVSFRISHSGGGAFGYTVKRQDGTTVVVIATIKFATVIVDDAGVWQLIAFGALA